MRVILTGSTGRLGGAFLSLWGEGSDSFEVQTMTRADADLAKPDELYAVLKSIWQRQPFDALINPAAMSGLEQCLDFPEEARQINVESPRVMADFCQEMEVRMVHFSTDYVFDGEASQRLCEDDETGAVNDYGRTKREGELAVLEASENALVCRVSWLFGPATGKSHFDHVLDRALAGESQNLIADKFSIPTYTHDIVEWTRILLESETSGVYHLCNSGKPESWFSYAQKVCKLAEQHGYLIEGAKLVASSLKDADFFRERRPVFTTMLPKRLLSEGLAEPRTWLEAAKDYLKIR